jgi:signal transduction histidine kinase
MRLSARPTGGEHSTGLGLSIVKKLADAMGAQIGCDSSLGNGATFFLEVPCATPEQIAEMSVES